MKLTSSNTIPSTTTSDNTGRLRLSGLEDKADAFKVGFWYQLIAWKLFLLQEGDRRNWWAIAAKHVQYVNSNKYRVSYPYSIRIMNWLYGHVLTTFTQSSGSDRNIQGSIKQHRVFQGPPDSLCTVYESNYY
jgi:hypothetical protein